MLYQFNLLKSMCQIISSSNLRGHWGTRDWCVFIHLPKFESRQPRDS